MNKSGHWAVHLHRDCSGLTYDQEWTSKWISVETVDFSGEISVNKSGFQLDSNVVDFSQKQWISVNKSG